jgi:hypothetical protein
MYDTHSLANVPHLSIASRRTPSFGRRERQSICFFLDFVFTPQPVASFYIDIDFPLRHKDYKDTVRTRASMALEKTIYIGPFIHCESLTQLDVCTMGMIGVDEDGKIAFKFYDMKGRQYPAQQGWEQAKVVRIQDHGFFFPGFIGLSR